MTPLPIGSLFYNAATPETRRLQNCYYVLGYVDQRYRCLPTADRLHDSTLWEWDRFSLYSSIFVEAVV